jgi:hypothetical protein
MEGNNIACCFPRRHKLLRRLRKFAIAAVNRKRCQFIIAKFRTIDVLEALLRTK